MEFGRLRVVQEYAGMVVELHDDHGRLDAEVKRAVRLVGPDPAEISRVEVTFALLQLHRSRFGREVEEILLQDREDEVLLRRVQGRDRDAFVGHDSVIPEGATEVSLIVAVPSSTWHGGVFHSLEDLSFCLEFWGERLHQFQAQCFLFVQNLRACVGPAVDLIGLCTGEPGRDDYLGAVEEDVQAKVVSVEGNAPGIRGGGRSKEHDVVRMLVTDGRAGAELAEEVIDAHGCEGLLVTFW